MLYGRREQACLFPAENKTTINSAVETGFHPRLKDRDRHRLALKLQPAGRSLNLRENFP